MASVGGLVLISCILDVAAKIDATSGKELAVLRPRTREAHVECLGQFLDQQGQRRICVLVVHTEAFC